MREPLTSEEVLEMGKMWGDNLFTLVPPEEAFSHYKAEDAARFYKPEELIPQYKPEEVFRHFRQEEIEAYLRSIKNNQLGSASG